MAKPVTCSVSVVVGAVASVDIGVGSRVAVSCFARRWEVLTPTYVFMNTLYSTLYAVAAVILS